MPTSQILIVMVVAIGLTIFAERKGIQPPLLLAMVGLAASFIPGLPRVLAAQRQALIDDRDAGHLDDEIMREVLEGLDVEQAAVASRSDRVEEK